MRNPKDVTRGMLLLFIVTTLFTAVTDFAEGRYLTASWIAFAGTLSGLAAVRRYRDFLLLSLPFWAAALARLYFIEFEQVGFTLIINTRFLMYLLATAFLAATYLAQRNAPLGKYMPAFAYAAMFTVIVGSLLENHDFFMDAHYRNLGYSYVLVLFAILFLGYGFAKNHKNLRICGIVLAVLVVLKLYLHDIWTMSRLVRIIAGFSLGITLVVLSLLYQKYRDRLFPKKTGTATLSGIIMPLALLFILSGAGAGSAHAADFRESGWLYYKGIAGFPAERGGERALPAYGVFVLDDDLIRYGSACDLRVVWEGRALPYFTRIAMEDPKLSGANVPTVIFSDKNADGMVYVLKLPDIPEETSYRGLEIAAAEHFEVSVTLETAKKAGEWSGAQTYSLFSYGEEKSNRIDCNAGEGRYARLTFNSKIAFSFPRAFYSAKKKESFYTFDIPPASLTRDQDVDSRSTVYYFENPGRKKISRLLFRFSDRSYDRSMRIHTITLPSRKFEYFMSARIARASGQPDTQVIDLVDRVSTAIKIVIVDGDDKPLTLTGLTASVIKEELVFTLPDAEEARATDGKGLRVYYGNSYCTAPDYDIAKTFDAGLGSVLLQPGTHTKNEAFAYSIMEPPVSTWIIRALFLLGLVALAYPAWRILWRYAGEVEPVVKE